MWTVIKYKTNNYFEMKKSLEEKLGNSVSFYRPEIKYQKKFKTISKLICKPILNNYVFCFSKKFEINQSILTCKYLRGIEYFLNGHISNQKKIISFINFCKKYENKEGSILPEFFSDLRNNKGKFMNGPFSNIIFEILEKNKTFMKVSFGNFKARVKLQSKNFFSPCFN